MLAAGSTYTAGSTGGEATHTLTIDEMPSHEHRIGSDATMAAGSKYVIRENTSGGIKSGKTGGGKAHNNMPPYLVVYVWKRVA